MTDNASGPSLEDFDRWLAEKDADWEQKIRQRLVARFSALVGPHRTGDDFVRGMWRDVLPPSWEDSRVADYARTKSWCGGTLLHMYRSEGIADGVYWEDGVGFVYPQNLPITHKPKPGDVIYKNDPNQHYGMALSELDYSKVQYQNGPHVETVEANSDNENRERGIWKHRRMVTPRGGWTFFSIAPLLKRALERRG